MNSQNSNNLQQLKQNAENAIEASEWNKAKSILSEIIQIDKSDHIVWYEMGYCHLMLEEIDQAIDCLRRSISVQPGLENVYLTLSHAYIRASDITSTIEILQELIKLFPDSAEGYRLLGGAYMLNAQDFEAEECFLKSLDILPDQSYTRLHLGALQSRMLKFDSAIKHLNIVLDSGELAGEAHIQLGNTYKDSGEYDKAIKHYETAMVLMPDATELKANLDLVREKLNG